MISVILVFHVMVAVVLIALILLQQSEGGGLGVGGGNNFMSPRGTANLLTKATSILAGIFFVTSLGLVALSGTHNKHSQSVLDAASVDEPVKDQSAAPKSDTAPSVPIQ